MPIPAPVGVKFVVVPTGIQISWLPVTGATSYNVYKGQDTLALFNNQINTSPILGTSFIDTKDDPTIVNYYAVVAVDGTGNFSLSSALLAVDIRMGDFVPRVDLTPTKFDTLIDQKGYTVVWEQAVQCPCTKSSQTTTDANDIACRICGNKHYVWFNPTNISVIVTSLTRKSELAEDGKWLAGTYMVTTKSGNKLGMYDRLTFTNSVASYTESLVKGTFNGMDTPRFPAVVVNLPIIDRAGNLYKFGTDFNIGAGGNIQWLSTGNQPNTGVFYGINYLTDWRMLIIDYPHDIRSTKVQRRTPTPISSDLATQAVGKLEFFFGI